MNAWHPYVAQYYQVVNINKPCFFICMYFHTINLTRYRKRVLHQTKRKGKLLYLALKKHQ